MRTIGLLCALSILFFAGCGSSDDDNNDNNANSGGSFTLVVNYGTFAVTGASALSSHIAPPTPSTGDLIFEVGPGTPPIGAGSGEWRIGADGDSGEELRFHVLANVLLANITRLSYWTYVENDFSGVPVVAVTLSLRVDWNNDGLEDDRIFFEPEYQHGALFVPSQGDLVFATWQEWDALLGGWWSNNDPAFPPGVGVGTLASYIAAHPGVKVITHTDGSGGTRLNAGYGATSWNNFIGNADGFEVGVLGNVITFDLDP